IEPFLRRPERRSFIRDARASSVTRTTRHDKTCPDRGGRRSHVPSSLVTRHSSLVTPHSDAIIALLLPAGGWAGSRGEGVWARAAVQLSCVQENLPKGLGIVGRAVATRSTLPVLSNVLLESDQSRLKLAATNLEIGVTCWIGAMIEQEGSITVPGRLLNDLIASLPPDKIVSLQTKGASLKVACSGVEANLRGIAADEFPVIPQVSNPASCAVGPPELQEALSPVAFAAATDDTRPVLAGVLFSFRGDMLTMAAADGFRLAVRGVEVARPLGQDVDIVVPVRAVQELARIVGDQEEPVEIVLPAGRERANQVLFHLNNVDLVSRLIDGTFPNVQQIIPTKFQTRVILTTKDFQNANKIASLVARDANNIV